MGSLECCDPVVVLLFVAPLLFKATANPMTVNPVDCHDVFNQNRANQSGVYTIYPSDQRFGIPVYCDADTAGKKWTVILKRSDGSENFFRPWDHYAAGFGDINAEYWLGLDFIHKLTTHKQQELQVDMEDFEGNKASAYYSSFSVGGDCDGYKLNVSGFINKGAGDSFSFNNGMKFSTFDKDQDVWNNNCARAYMGGFWYRYCHQTNPTGVYLWGNAAYGAPSLTGVIWRTWKGNVYSLKSITFKIRPV
uniref:Microfibril associated protein 4 n=2 Tax=Neogobius melanostomus TaxID=47308 RepID=A0A8C6UAF7_9GOBI